MVKNLNVDILAMISPYLDHHDISAVMRSCRAMHSYCLPYLLSDIGERGSWRNEFNRAIGDEDDPFGDGPRWVAFLRTVQADPPRWMTHIRFLTFSVVVLNRVGLMSAMLTVLRDAVNMVSLRVEECYGILPSLVDSLVASQCPLRSLKLYHVDPLTVDSFLRLSCPITFMTLFMGENLLRGDERVLESLLPFADTLENLGLGFTRIARFGAPPDDGIVFPHLRTLDLVEVYGPHFGFLCHTFPALRALRHKFIGYHSVWENAHIERAHNLIFSSPSHPWSSLDHVESDVGLFYRMAFTCPIHYLNVIRYQLIQDGVPHFAEALILAKPIILSLSLSSDVSAEGLDTLVRAAALNLRCLELDIPKMGYFQNARSRLALTEALPHALAQSRIKHLHIKYNGLACRTNSNQDAVFLDERLDELEHFIERLASTVSTLELIMSQYGPKGWLISRHANGNIVISTIPHQDIHHWRRQSFELTSWIE